MWWFRLIFAVATLIYLAAASDISLEYASSTRTFKRNCGRSLSSPFLSWTSYAPTVTIAGNVCTVGYSTELSILAMVVLLISFQ